MYLFFQQLYLQIKKFSPKVLYNVSIFQSSDFKFVKKLN